MWVLAPPIIWTMVAGPPNNSDLGTALLLTLIYTLSWSGYLLLYYSVHEIQVILMGGDQKNSLRLFTLPTLGIKFE